jgi:hypothetical protein
MSTIEIPPGFAAVVVFVATGDKDDTIKVEFFGQEEGTEHAILGDAICALAMEQVSVADAFIEEIEELEAEDPDEADDEPAGEGP